MNSSVIAYAQSLLAQAQPATPAVNTVWELALRGGWVMIPIVLCSLVALTIVVERLIVLRASRVTPPGLLSALQSLRNDRKALAARCSTDPSPLAGVLLAASRAQHLPRETRDRLIEESGHREIQKLRARVRLLSALPQVATMLGLLGTVVGMIRTFTVIAASGDSLGKTERLAQGIYEAWTATAAGLTVAIPTLIAYHIILARIDAAAASLDRHVGEFLADDPAPATAHAAREIPSLIPNTEPSPGTNLMPAGV